MRQTPPSLSGYRVQKTLQTKVEFSGVGLHSGKPSLLRVLPAAVNHGIRFRRVDLSPPVEIRAHYDSVTSTLMATSLGPVGTVEHLMSALFGLGITNVLIELNGPEIPILDGSAGPFVDAFVESGFQLQKYSAPTLKVLKAIKVYQNDTVCELLPREGLRITATIDFPHPLIGLQTFAVELTPETFMEEIGRARTFGFIDDVERLKGMGLAHGASMENVLAFSQDELLNPEGSRFANECVRHKILDAIGDLALCGFAIEGELVSYRGGHAVHLALMEALRKNQSFWEIYPAEPLDALYERQIPVISPGLGIDYIS